MASLKTKYMGIELKNPIIAGASSLTSNMGSIKKLEDAGAAALIFASLFEEQVQLEQMMLEEDLARGDYRHAEMIDIFPDLEHAGPAEHLIWVRKAKESVEIPVIASLNAVNKETWIEYAKQLEETGVDALELNFYSVPSDFEKQGSEYEDEQIAVLKELKKKVSVPFSVKLSVYYSNPLNFIKKVDAVGIDGFVLFNRFFQPDIDISKEQNTFPLNLSNKNDNRFPLRYAGLLFGNVKADVCSSTGIMFAEDVIKMILAGANCVQCVSTLFKNKVTHLGTMVQDLEKWMDEKGYKNLDSFRGKLSRKNSKDPWSYTRAQYVKLLLNPKKFLKSPPNI
jgi:dihydroorotate dehydrogenase (fumarate)